MDRTLLSTIGGNLLGVALVATSAVILHDISLEKTPEPIAIPIPAECGKTFNCQPAWLSRVLSFPIESLTINVLGGGYTSQSYRLTFSSPSEVESNSAVVKYTNPEDLNCLTRFLFWFLAGGVEIICEREKYFYNHMREEFLQRGIKTPQSYYAEIEDHGRRSFLLHMMGCGSNYRSLLIMEDLCKHKVFGLKNSFPEEYAHAAARNLAVLHGAFWGDKIKVLTEKNPSLEEVPYAYIFFFSFKVNRFTSYPQTKEEVRRRLSNWAPEFSAFQNPTVQNSMETFVDIFPKLLKYFNNDIATSGPLFRQHTFLHGDYNAGNLFFATEPSTGDGKTPKIRDVFLIDWQGYGVGHPSTEVAFFLGFIEPDPELDLRIMQTYYEELTKTVPPEIYPFEVMVREVEIRTMGMGVSAMYYFSDTPAGTKKKNQYLVRNGIQLDDMITSRVTTITRMAYIIDKWEKEGILQNLDKLDYAKNIPE